MSKFKVGDRVAVYNSIMGRAIKEIKYIEGDYLHFEEGVEAHYKACRRLVKKKRKEVWVSEEFLKEWKTLADCPHIKPDGDFSDVGYVKFREVKD